MSEVEREVLIPSDEEEEAIQRGIALDPDAPEWTDEDWARARPAVEAVPTSWSGIGIHAAGRRPPRRKR